MDPDIEKWLTQQGLVPFYEKGPVVLAQPGDDHPLTPGMEARGDRAEVACLVVSPVTLKSGVAQGHLNQLVRWRRRARGDLSRRVTVFVPREISEIDLVGLRDFDLLVRTPLRGIYPGHKPS